MNNNNGFRVWMVVLCTTSIVILLSCIMSNASYKKGFCVALNAEVSGSVCIRGETFIARIK